MTLAALLIDYQNLHHFLKNRLGDTSSPIDGTTHLVRALRERLADEDISIARGCAYADFGGLDDHTRHVQRTLYLHGIIPVYVPDTMHRNSTDLQLSVDAVELRNRYTEIETFVLLGGDRDYAPVTQALLSGGKHVYHVGFREHLSPHLLEHTEGGIFIDAAELLPEGTIITDDQVGEPIETTEFTEITEIENDVVYDALQVTHDFFGQYDEIYLTPLLRRLSDELGTVPGYDPKSLVSSLEDCGAARLERRRGMPYDYTVLILNEDHPDVIEVQESSDQAIEEDGFDGVFDDEPEAYEHE